MCFFMPGASLMATTTCSYFWKCIYMRRKLLKLVANIFEHPSYILTSQQIIVCLLGFPLYIGNRAYTVFMKMKICFCR